MNCLSNRFASLDHKGMIGFEERDRYLTGNNGINFFNVPYKRHTSIEIMQLIDVHEHYKHSITITTNKDYYPNKYILQLGFNVSKMTCFDVELNYV